MHYFSHNTQEPCIYFDFARRWICSTMASTHQIQVDVFKRFALTWLSYVRWGAFGLIVLNSQVYLRSGCRIHERELLVEIWWVEFVDSCFLYARCMTAHAWDLFDSKVLALMISHDCYFYSYNEFDDGLSLFIQHYASAWYKPSSFSISLQSCLLFIHFASFPKLLDFLQFIVFIICFPRSSVRPAVTLLPSFLYLGMPFPVTMLPGVKLNVVPMSDLAQNEKYTTQAFSECHSTP